MIEDIKDEILTFVDKQPINSFISVKMLYNKLYLERKEWDNIALPGYFKGWVKPVNKILKNNTKFQMLKMKGGWRKKYDFTKNISTV